MLVKAMDNQTIVNVGSISHINLSTENISSTYGAVITAYFINGGEKILGRYKTEKDAQTKLDSFYRAFHEKNVIFDF